MTPGRHGCPPLNVEGPFHPGTGRHREFAGEQRHTERRRNSFTGIEDERIKGAFLVDSDGVARCAGEPVKGQGGEEMVQIEDPLEIAVAIAPGAVLLGQPGREPDRGVRQPVGEGLRPGRVDVGIGSFGL
jgi:hypothetical protein